MGKLQNVAENKNGKVVISELKEVTCDCCSRPFMAVRRRAYCFHCNKYFYVCPSCASNLPKCRYCGIPLARKIEPVGTKR